ncbi:hypothetical protein SSX86_017674 [Deinandra increscens subsp. villosa]|uniref:RING-type E3 ubiquitin transferase n=1 Tax=Deinandra increscens subsp. villosa TaxID=3103831 RepID=A0AAP0D0I6_9ASTR
MAISVSSYEIIFPDSREIIIVNAKPGEHVDNLLIINPSPTQEPMIQSVLFGDYGGPAFTTRLMELKTTDEGSVATPVSMDDQSNDQLDHEKCVMIKDYIMAYESQKILEQSVKSSTSGENDDNEEEEAEEEVCVICQGGCETGEMIAVLECRHWYHEDCLVKWLKQKNDCPICRAEVIPFVSIIYRFIS